LHPLFNLSLRLGVTIIGCHSLDHNSCHERGGQNRKPKVKNQPLDHVSTKASEEADDNRGQRHALRDAVTLTAIARLAAEGEVNLTLTRQGGVEILSRLVGDEVEGIHTLLLLSESLLVTSPSVAYDDR
jgi:hypothetical protein